MSRRAAESLTLTIIVNGRLIDFSLAWTVPHPVLVKEKMEDDEIMEVYDGGYSDACDVDKLIETWNNQHADRFKIWDRCRPNTKYCKNIRNRADCLKGSFGAELKWGRNTCGWYIRPELYKWPAKKGSVEHGEA